MTKQIEITDPRKFTLREEVMDRLKNLNQGRETITKASGKLDSVSSLARASELASEVMFFSCFAELYVFSVVVLVHICLQDFP